MKLFSFLRGKPPQKKIPITKYWQDLTVECPRCNASCQVDAPPVAAQGSDFLVSMCSRCGAYLLIDSRQENSFVVVEAFSSEAEVEKRILDRSRK